MSIHQVKMFFRYLMSNRTTTIINLIGLTAAFSIVIPIFLFLVHEFSFDKGFKERDNIARLVLEGTIGPDQYVVAPIGSAPMAVTMANNLDEIENFARVDSWGFGSENPITYNDITHLEKNIFFADSSFFDIFNYPFLLGDPKTALTTRYSVVITEKTAQKYFGAENPIGKQLMLANNPRLMFNVSGVIGDISTPTHFPDFPMICSWATAHSPRDDEDIWIQGINYLVYFKLKDGVVASDLTERLNLILDQNAGDILKQVGGEMKVHLQPLNDFYLGSNHFDFYDFPTGSKNNVTQFLIIGISILILAIFNFINLTTARSFHRGRQVGICKVLGATRNRLIYQHTLEAVALSFFAAVLSLLITNLMVDQFEKLLAINIHIDPVKDYLVTIVFLAGSIVIGLVAGIYPAFYVTAFNPISVMRGQLKSGVKGQRIRSAFVVFQYTITVILILSTLQIMRQLNYLRHKDLGFNQEQIVAFRLPNADLREKHQVFKTEVKKLPGVIGVGSASQLPDDIGNNSIYHVPGRPDDEQIQVAGYSIGENYINLLDIKLIEGRDFDPGISTDRENAIIVNDAFMQSLGWDSIEGKYLEAYESLDPPKMVKMPIIGRTKDVHFTSLHNKVKPMLFTFSGGRQSYVYFKLAPDQIPSTMESIKKAWVDFAPGIPSDYLYLDELFHDAYQKEEHLGHLLQFFTCLALFIAGLGLFALVSFSAEQRTKEFGIRKIFGASSAGLLNLLVKEYVVLIMLASVIALPVSFWLVNKWMENFAYSTGFTWWLFPLSAMGAVCVALITVGVRALRIANVNPVASLRSE